MNELIQSLRDAFDPLVSLIRPFPWLLLVFFTLPLLAAARWLRAFPTWLLGLCLLVPTVLTMALLPWEEGSSAVATIAVFVLLLDTAVLAIAGIDLLSFPRAKHLSAERQVMRIASLQQNHKVTLTISNHSNRTYRVVVRDDVPQEFEPSPKQFVLRLEKRSRATVHYEMLSSRRGAFEQDRVYLRVRSLLRLWHFTVLCPVKSLIHVYPDMKQLAEYAVLARTNRLSLMGVRRTRKIGQDNEFERLRDYTRDDNFKHIDWRTTARRNKLTVKDFQTNQSQRIIFLVDCGRMMTNVASGLSLLDHSLNAMLMMSFVALRQGDSVGLICFADEIINYVPPKGGMKQMNQLLHASFDRFPKLVESRYDDAFLYLGTHCPKRALVVLISNVIDEVNSNQVQQYLSSMVGRHLPLGVLLRDHSLFDAADSPAAPGNTIYRAAAAAEILTWRHQVLTDLEHNGVLTIDTFPEDMTAPLVNRYLEIKARHLL